MQDPEFVHDNFTRFGKLLGSSEYARKLTRASFYYKNSMLNQTIAGIKFSNPIGLSAGFDKDANLVSILPEVGFGYSQVGTVTYEAYEGNPKPRLYRLPKSKALVVYYGLKNIGVKKIAKKLKRLPKNKNFPISISVGKTNCKRTATVEAGIEDYYDCYKYLVEENIGDFYTINISCPNTFGGEPFTTPKELDMLLGQLRKVKNKKPMFLKMPIVLSWKEFEKLLKIAIKYKVDGVIIGNLNKDHKHSTIKDAIPNGIKGGISGRPTWKLSNDLIANTYKNYGDKLTIVGVGGIFNAQDAYEKIKLGSSLIQLITGMIYEGPQLIGEINEGLVELMERDGYSNISEAVGASVK